jgi:putative ABC transport system permease protein
LALYAPKSSAKTKVSAERCPEFLPNLAYGAGAADVAGVLPTMGHAANSGLPAAVVSVYTVPMMIGLALAGLVIAVAGALAPAWWAAHSRTATALCTE